MELGRKGKLLFLLGGLLVGLPAAQAEQGGILILGIRQKNQFSERLGKAVERRLERVGEPLAVGKRPLSEADRSCQTQECLLKLAESRKAAWILGGEIREGGPRSYFISMWLFDVMGGRLLEEKGDCQECDEAALGDAVASTTGRLLDRRRAPVRVEPLPVVPLVVAPPQSVVTPPTAPAPTPSRPGGLVGDNRVLPEPVRKHGVRLTIGRKIGAGVLGAALAIVLASTIAASASTIEGPCGYLPSNGSPICNYSSRLIPIVGYSLSGIMLGGFVLTLTLP